MGEESSSGGTDYSGRLQDKRSRAEARARADAQSRAKLGKRGRTESGFRRKKIGDDFKTVTESRTELARRDLDRRADEGQMSERSMNNPIFGGLARGINEFGKQNAGRIRSKIDAGGTAVYDRSGRIRGVEKEQDTLFGRQKVYTGNFGFDPKMTGAKIGTSQFGTGYQTTVADEARGEVRRAGNDGPDEVVSTPVMSNATTSGDPTKLSAAARKRQLSLGAGAGGGAKTRQFLA
tara:strand:- start:3112 stop:3816 length:705 start_codon:yes stop_codon:yes gene_type:complete